MAKRTKKRWSYRTGEKGRNRVRVFEHGSGIIMLEFRDGAQRKRRSLGHRDRDRAKRQADEAAARLASEDPPTDEPTPDLTLGQLFDMYEVEKTPQKAESTQKHDRRAMEMFRRYWGQHRAVSSLDRRDHDRFIQDRRSGEIGPAQRRRTKGVGDRAIEQDLRLLHAIFNWAVTNLDSSGGPLLERNPFQGLTPPRERSPNRVVLTQEEYDALLGVAKEIDWRFHVALVLAHETGHRAGAIAALRWSDLDLDDRRIRWRAESEKTRREHITPMTEQARQAIEYARQHSAGVGEAPLLPAPKDSSVPVSRHLLRDWWKRAEERAELSPKRGRGWHSLRRKFASDLMHAPLKELCELGGWKDFNTILKCYQFPDQDRLANTLATRGVPPGPGGDGGERAQSGPVEETPAETPKLRLIR